MRGNFKKTRTLVAVGLTAVSGAAFADIYANWAALAASPDYTQGVDYDVQVHQIPGWDRQAPLYTGANRAVIAIHGGQIEVQTSELAWEIAHYNEPVTVDVCDANGGNCTQTSFDWFANLFQMRGHIVPGTKQDGTAKANADLHITATHFDEPQAVTMVRHATSCLSIHGMADNATISDGAICVGGLDANARQRFWNAVVNDPVLDAAIELTDVQLSSKTSWGVNVPANSKCHGLSATQPANIVNLCGADVDPNVPGGLQLELNRPLRDRLKVDAALRERFVQAARDAMP